MVTFYMYGVRITVIAKCLIMCVKKGRMGNIMRNLQNVLEFSLFWDVSLANVSEEPAACMLLYHEEWKQQVPQKLP
jgi:hypothetical protein